MSVKDTKRKKRWSVMSYDICFHCMMCQAREYGAEFKNRKDKTGLLVWRITNEDKIWCGKACLRCRGDIMGFPVVFKYGIDGIPECCSFRVEQVVMLKHYHSKKEVRDAWNEFVKKRDDKTKS